MHMMRNISHGFPQQNIIVTVYHNMHHLPTALDTTANPLYTSCKQKRILQSNEQEKYLASHGFREPGLLETGTSAVKEWAWELASEPPVQTGVVLVSERPPWDYLSFARLRN